MKYSLAIFLMLAGSFLLGTSAHAADQQMCYDLYQPVCASHQVECFAAPCYPQYKTYSNSCFAAQDNATIIHDGECTASETGSILPVATSSEPYKPPAGCTAYFDGCNSCGVNPDGSTVCTLLACVTKQPGYCKAYAATSSPTNHDTGTVSPAHPIKPVTAASSTMSSSSPVATSTASATTTVSHGFWYTLWHFILSWFGIH